MNDFLFHLISVVLLWLAGLIVGYKRGLNEGVNNAEQYRKLDK